MVGAMGLWQRCLAKDDDQNYTRVNCFLILVLPMLNP